MSEDHRVRDVMTSPATTIPHDARLIDAVLTLRSSGFRHLPVVDGERLVGILSDRDIQRLSPSLLAKVSPEEYNAIFENTSLARVMTRNPVTVAPETPIAEAATIMRERQVGCLPVVEADRLVGILAKADMLNFLIRLLTGVEQGSPVQGS